MENKIYDSHIHYNRDGIFDQVKINDVRRVLELNNVSGGILYHLNENWYECNYHKYNYPSNVIPGFLVNPRDERVLKKIDVLHEMGYKILKILPYEQNLDNTDYNGIFDIAKRAMKYDMCLTICCAYGSENLYKINGVEIIAYLLNNGINTPLICAHGGMLRLMDAFLLMEVYENLYMDISFAVDYWKGSSIVMDYAYVINKMEGERIFYGTDYPFMDMKHHLECFYDMCKKYNVNEENQRKILSENFENFIERWKY